MNKSTIEAMRAEALNHVLLEESTELTSEFPLKTSSLEATPLPLVAPHASRWKGMVWTTLWWILGFGAAFSGGWWMATQREHESEKIALPPSPTSDSGTAMKVTASRSCTVQSDASSKGWHHPWTGRAKYLVKGRRSRGASAP